MSKPNRTARLFHPHADRHPLRARLGVEALEDRSVPAAFTVSSLADAGPGSLRQAVRDANASPGADTIVFAPAVRGNIVLTGGELVVTDELTVAGPGTARLTLSGDQASRVFNSTARLTVADVTIANGLATGGEAIGGGILNTGSTLTLQRTNFANNWARADGANHAVAGGGAVASVRGASLTVEDCVFTANTAHSPYWGAGGAILNDVSSTLTLIRGTFTGNSVTGLYDTKMSFGGVGGAIANLGESTATVIDSTFTGNLARGLDAAPGEPGGYASGGAIANSFSILLAGRGGSRLLVEGGLFSGNECIGGAGGDATSNGNGNQGQGGEAGFGFAGAVLVDAASDVTIRGASFVGNRARGGRAGNGSNNGGDGIPGAGGAIAVSNAFLTVERSSFTGNEALGGAGGNGSIDGGKGGSGRGGAIYVTGISSFPGVRSVVTISDATFSENRSGGGTGGAGGTGRGGNGGIGRGGAIATNGQTVTVRNCRLEDNQALGGTAGLGATAGNGGEAQGGGLAFGFPNTSFSGADGVLVLSGGVLIGNQARGGVGAVGGLARGGGLFVGLSASAAVSGTTFDGNLVQGGAGSIQGGDGQGGAVHNEGNSQTELRGCTVTNNRAVGGTGPVAGQGLGGGVYNAAGGVVKKDASTLIFGNDASTSDDDTFGVIIPL